MTQIPQIHLTSDHSISMKGSGLVDINTSIVINGTSTELPIKITADFNNIPQHLHQMYFEALNYQYNKSVNVYSRTKDDDKEPMTIAEQKTEWRLNKITNIISKALRK